ncbi:MAG: TolC family protein [Pseudomonadales bacterium]|nr:TolC family protein [Pseudomonadales bacterium]
MRWKMLPLFLLTCTLMSPSQAGPLGELLRAALDHPGIEAKRMEVRAAEETLSAETSRYFGSGELSAGWNRYEDNRLVGPFVPDLLMGPIPQDREIVRYGISYRLPLDIFDVIGAARDKAKNDIEAARLAERQQTLLKLHQVTTAWVQLQALDRQQAGLQKRYQTLGRTMERVQAEVELGKAAEVDLRLAESELARVEADRVRLTGSIRQARAQLIEATGQSGLTVSGEIYVPPWQTVEIEETIPVRLQGAVADAAKAQSEQVRKSLWPGVSLGGDYYEFDGADVNPASWRV